MKDNAAVAMTAVTEQQVADYLRDNPDFLVHHPDLALELTAPARWRGERVNDLHAFMIERLRGELDEMRGCAEHLITTSRSNMSTQSRTHEAVVAVLGATGMAALAQVVAEDLPRLLDVDVATLAMEFTAATPKALAVAGVQPLPAGTVATLMGEPAREVALLADGAGEPLLFGAAAETVRSAALVLLPATATCPPGLFLLGSREPEAFHPGQGTELLMFLSAVVEHAVRRWAAAD